MNTEYPSAVTIRLAVDSLDPHLVNIHDAPRIAITLTPGGAERFAYLVGTPDELHWLCDKLRAIVTAHESSTRLAGEAAERIAANYTDAQLMEWVAENMPAYDGDDPECVFAARVQFERAIAAARS